VRVFDTCRLRFRYQYVDKQQGRVKPRLRPADTAGSLVHRVLCDFFSKVPEHQRDRQRLLDMFEDGWRALSPNYHRVPGVEEHREASLRQLNNFAEKFDLDARPFAVEPFFQQEVAPGVTLFGRLDRVDEEPDGTLHIIDYKGSEQPEEIDPKQLAIYALLLEAGAGRTASKASFWYLDDGSIWTTDLDAESKRSALQDLLVSVEEMNSVAAFPPTIGPHCSFCPYLKVCEVRKEIAERRTREGW
jgi:putative RecB family exonuclease